MSTLLDQPVQLGPTRALSEYQADVCESSDIRVGYPFPFGAHERGGGVNFAIFSRHALRVRLELFDSVADAVSSRSFELDCQRHRTGDVWHIWIHDLKPGQLYGYRMNGPYLPREGLRFNFHRLLLDPCATAISSMPGWKFGPACGYDLSAEDQDLTQSLIDNAGCMPKCVYTGGRFDWEGDQSPRHPWSNTIIYELHVRGFTFHPSSGVTYPGTYRGLVEKIPYLKQLGITAVELMPVQEFNETQVKSVSPHSGKRLGNYWGYDPVSFLAPKASYSSAGGLGQQKLEFQEMVKSFHQAGIEVIVDIVLNHTAEGDQYGPTLSLRGIDNPIYYALTDDKRYYRNFTGTGNSINAGHPVVRDHILSALCHWVVEMHVDGFRFDLASVLGRDEQGNLVSNSPLLERIAEDPILRETKLIAEAWDAGGAYEVGSFSQRRWAEWNGRYRDDVRRFWRGDAGMRGVFASRLCGSSDIYLGSGKGPECSINYVTAHDGLTLNDLVTYAYKHNELNGEGNRDGTDDNLSSNFGIEGITDNLSINVLRLRQIKNFLLTLFVSRGVPMILGGDEFRRTQRGNNNAYCQDNEVSWFDWTYLKRHEDLQSFTRRLITFRKQHPVFSRERFYEFAEIHWLDSRGNVPDWWNWNARDLACEITESDSCHFFLIFNAGQSDQSFRLPERPQDSPWRVVLDSARPTVLPDRKMEDNISKSYVAWAHSSVILIASRSKEVL